MKKNLGGTDLNQMKISRSTRRVNSDGSRQPRRGNKSEHDQSFVVSSSDIEASPHSSRSINVSSAMKISFQASPHTPEYSYSRIDGKSKPSSVSPGQKSSARTLTRKASLKPLRASTKMAGAKSKRGSLINHTEISQLPELSVERATCSSTLKDSKFPDTLELQQGGNKSEGSSVMKVCTFSYCSLHSHRHANASVPPLKRLISMRRRSLRSQKSIRSENRSIHREKRSGKDKKGRISRLVEEVDRELSLEPNTGREASKSSGLGGYGEEDAKVTDSLSLAETLVGETSYPLSNLEENLNKVYDFPIVVHDSLLTNPAPVEVSSLECCCANTELNRPVSGPSDKEEAGTAASKNNQHWKNDSESVGKSMERNDTATGKPDESSFATSSKLENEQMADKEEKENLEPDEGFFQFPPSKDSELNGNNNGTQRMQLKDQKYVRMWRLMYKHAVKGVAGMVENQVPLDQVDKTEQVEGAEGVESNNSESFRGLTETDQAIPVDSVNAGKQQMELYQNDAVKLVQEAFDEILLPEIQELSSDDRSVKSGITSDQELNEQVHVDGTSSLKEEKTSLKVGAKSELKVSKSWSNLKKIIVLKRFTKALEKVKKINKREPRYLPLQPDPEAEKVNLRHQTAEERKNAEEWMLDYALQQVISKLAPPQQRRVAMLVKAFETVLPLPDLKSSPSFNLAEHIREDKVQACGKETDERDCTEVLIRKTSRTTKTENEYADQVNDFVKAEQQGPVEFLKLKDVKQEENVPLSESTDKDWNEEHISANNIDNQNSKVIRPTDQPDSSSILSTSHEVLHDEDVQVVPKQSLSLEACDAGYELCDTKSENTNMIVADKTLVISSAPIYPSEDSVAAREEENERSELASGLPQESSQIEESESDGRTDIARDTHLEKQSYMRLWCLVYKHMASGISAKGGSGLDDEPDEKKVDDSKTTKGNDIYVSCQSLQEKDQNTNMKDDTADNEKAVLRRIEAIKLIEKAIDDILLPENQDNPADDQSTASESITDEEAQQKKISIQEPLISGSIANESFQEASRKEEEELRVQENEERATDNITIPEEQRTSSNQKMPRSWSNLKKMILLKRFIKALENVRKFTPRGPRFLPLEADPEAEKVNLKHQDVDERKSAEEWMLDYALQQAVAKLTPARKRKVKLLVEAFETVTPTIRT